MTTPMPLAGAPYISPVTLTNAPTGIDWTSIPVGDDVTLAENESEWWNMCQRATAKVNGYCNQVLRATIDDELLHGPDYRVTVGPAGGGSYNPAYWMGSGSCSYNARVRLARFPILQIVSVSTCPNTVFPRTWRPVPSGFFEPETPPIGIYGSVAPSAEAFGGQSIIVAPGYIDWVYGRNGYAVHVQYVNGFPHAQITTAAAAGATSLLVDDCTGWGLSSYVGSATGATGVVKDGGQQETVHAASTSVVSGPGTLTLSSPLVYPHPAGTIVTTLPAQIEQACILFATAEALTRGATTTTIHDIGGHSQNTGGDVAGLNTEAELLCHPFKCVI